MLLIVFQIMESMGFNGLFDLPQLFMILMLMSVFIFRESIKVKYAYMVLFLTYYI